MSSRVRGTGAERADALEQLRAVAAAEGRFVGLCDRLAQPLAQKALDQGFPADEVRAAYVAAVRAVGAGELGNFFQSPESTATPREGMVLDSVRDAIDREARGRIGSR